MRPAILLATAFVAAGCALSVPLLAAPSDDITVHGLVDAEKIGESDSITFTIEVKGSSLPNVEEPDLAGLSQFTIGSGPNVSSSTSVVWDGSGGRATSTRRFVYQLVPKTRGTLTIPSFAVVVGGKPYRTAEVHVEVVAGSVQPSRRSGPFQRGPFESSPGERRSAPPAGDVFVEATLDRKEAYVGQQVILTYRIYTQVELASLPQAKQAPAYTGFWVEEIPVNPQASIERAVVRGKEYAQVTLAKKALFPTKSGDLPIEETLYEILARERSDDPFSRFFNPAQPLYRRTTPLSLMVLPLPSAGRPESFHGAVGSFKLSVVADRTEAQVNDAIGLTVKIEGDGNLRAAGDPVLPDLPDYKRFDPKVQDEKSSEGGRVTATRTWSYVLIPLAAGDRTIPPVRFAYFDPAAASYKELTGTPLTVKVSRAAGGTAVADGSSVRREVVAVGSDIRYIKPAQALGPGEAGLRHTGWFYALLLLPIAGNAALFVHLRRREHQAANVGLFRRRRASRTAKVRLRAARNLMTKADDAAFFAEVDRAATGFLADKFDESAAGLTRDRMLRLLEERGVAEDLRRRTLSCLERCDLGRFAARSSGRDQTEALLKQAEEVITSLERALG